MDAKPQAKIFDGHNDTLLDLHLSEQSSGRSFFERSNQGHIDLPRAREGGLAGGLFSVFVPAPSPQGLSVKASEQEFAEIDSAYAQRFAISLSARLFRLEADSQGALRVVRSGGELQQCIESDVFAAVLHFEGAEPIDPGLDALEVFYAAGLRSLGLVWSRPNFFGCGVPFKFPSSPDLGPGLSAAGRALVRACNSLGIVVDLAHINEKGFWDVASITDAPLVVSHAAAHAICPCSRNLTDRQLDAIRDSQGLVGVNFHVGFLREDGRRNPETPISQLVRHIEYLTQRLGVERVALGSDFDGAIMPSELGDAAGLPRLLEALRKRGWDEPSLEALTRRNWLDLLQRTWGG